MAPTGTSAIGPRRVNRRAASAPTAISALGTSVMTRDPMVQATASMTPTTAAASPRISSRAVRERDSRGMTRPSSIASGNDGRKMASVATTAPVPPASR
jgi:hypothetical protein